MNWLETRSWRAIYSLIYFWKSRGQREGTQVSRYSSLLKTSLSLRQRINGKWHPLSLFINVTCSEEFYHISGSLKKNYLLLFEGILIGSDPLFQSSVIIIRNKHSSPKN